MYNYNAKHQVSEVLWIIYNCLYTDRIISLLTTVFVVVTHSRGSNSSSMQARCYLHVDQQSICGQSEQSLAAAATEIS